MPLEDVDGFARKMYRVRRSIHNRLAAYARKEGRTLQHVVNEALKAYLDAATVAATPKSKKKATKTKNTKKDERK